MTRVFPIVSANHIGVCDDDDDDIDDFNNTGVPIVQFLQDVSQSQRIQGLPLPFHQIRNKLAHHRIAFVHGYGATEAPSAFARACYVMWVCIG